MTEDHLPTWLALLAGAPLALTLVLRRRQTPSRAVDAIAVIAAAALILVAVLSHPRQALDALLIMSTAAAGGAALLVAGALLEEGVVSMAGGIRRLTGGFGRRRLPGIPTPAASMLLRPPPKRS
jgi:hypothetical protein